jgi:O-antigen ligase
MVFSDVFCCFLGVCLLNVVFVFLLPSTPLGHAGYYSHKNTLGANAAIAFVLSIHEIFRGGIARRGLALSGILISLFLLLASQSKTSLGLAVICPALGIVIVSLTRFVKISPVAIIIYLSAVILSILIILSDATGLSLDDVSLLLFGDDTFTGRTIIWSFVSEMIELRPWFGWGYQSFWGSGPQALSRQAPDWVASMPQGHNGYLDTALDTGILGLGLLLGLLISGLHGVGTVVKESPRLGCLAISLMLFTILHNGLETTFMRASATLWILFIVVVALVASADEQRRPAA